MCEVAIPNKEIAAVYKSEILTHLLQVGAITRTTANTIVEALFANNPKKLQTAIKEYLDRTVSFYDAGAEGFYHGMMLGLIALMEGDYKIKSNRESGDGRFDICIFLRNVKNPGIIMEFKWKRNLDESELINEAEIALDQIEEKRYALELKEDGISQIMKLGIAFSGKKVQILMG